MGYTVIFWKKDYEIINGVPVLGEKKAMFSKEYRDTRNGVKEMMKDIKEWEDADRARNGTTSYWEE